MKLDAPILALELGDVAEVARAVEDTGVDGLFVFEGPREPFLRLALAAEHTRRATLSTQVAIALARNPMIVAQLAYDLHAFSRGRFVLGLGSQVKAHIERRFGAAWSRPTERMHEFVRALRAIWRSWQDGTRLAFQGEFYTHTLLPPLFNPGASEFGLPKVLIAGVGPRMTEVAAELGDGMLVHPFHTRRSLESVTLPAIARGLAAAGRTQDELEIDVQALIVTGRTEEDLAQARELTRQQIGFYASTPAYRSVLEAEGAGALQAELQALTREGRWGELGERIDDALLDAVAIRGAPEEIPRLLVERYGSIAARVSIASPFPVHLDAIRAIAEGLRALDATTVPR